MGHGFMGMQAAKAPRRGLRERMENGCATFYVGELCVCHLKRGGGIDLNR
jgi:hypothetical protein